MNIILSSSPIFSSCMTGETPPPIYIRVMYQKSITFAFVPKHMYQPVPNDTQPYSFRSFLSSFSFCSHSLARLSLFLSSSSSLCFPGPKSLVTLPRLSESCSVLQSVLLWCATLNWATATIRIEQVGAGGSESYDV